jgi:hypothetical protein
MAIQATTLAPDYIGIWFIVPMMLLASADAAGPGPLTRSVPHAHNLASLILPVFVLPGLTYTHRMKGHEPVPPLPFWHPVTLGGIFMFLGFFFEFVDHTRRFTA